MKSWAKIRGEMLPESRALMDERFGETLASMPIDKMCKARSLTQVVSTERLHVDQRSRWNLSLSSALRKCVLALTVMLICGSLVTVRAGLRGPGRYSGVVIFDRWDTCLLLSGVYITYMSDEVKEALRPHRNQAIQLDASVVSQPINPGDALIHKYTIIGPAPRSALGPPVERVKMWVQSDFESSRGIGFLITVKSSASDRIEIDSGEIGPTLLALKTPALFSAAGGRSAALITRANLLAPFAMSSRFGMDTLFATYEVDPSAQLPPHFSLNPGESKQARITMTASPGSYEFVVGYGGGVHESESIVSNTISFEVDKNGKPTLDNRSVPIAGVY